MVRDEVKGTIKLKKLVEHFQLKILHAGEDYETAEIGIKDVNRPGLQFVGFYDYFDTRRLQVIGMAETKMLEQMSPEQRTRSFDAFESMNFPPLAIIHDDRIIRHYTGVIPEPSDLKTYHQLDDRVFVLKLTPEVKADIFYLLKDHYDAIILETFGIGGIPEYDDSFQKAIFDWVDSGKTLAVTTQVPEEGCDLQVYQVGKKYSDYPGILQAGDMTTEAIVAKIMWVLGQTDDREKIQAMFEKVINLDRQEDIY